MIGKNTNSFGHANAISYNLQHIFQMFRVMYPISLWILSADLGCNHWSSSKETSVIGTMLCIRELDLNKRPSKRSCRFFVTLFKLNTKQCQSREVK